MTWILFPIDEIDCDKVNVYHKKTVYECLC